MKRLGIALGGGGIKGLAHIGVLQVLQENGIKPAYISGTSSGSIIAALYSCGIDPFKMEEIAYHISPKDYLDYNICGIGKYLLSLLIPCYHYNLEGLIKGKKLRQLIFKLTGGKTLSEIEMPLSIVACDINSGQKIIFTNQESLLAGLDAVIVSQVLISDAVSASCAIPVIFNPQLYNNLKLLDGGLKDYVPSIVQKLMGAPVILAVNLGNEKYIQPVKGIYQIASRSLDILTYETSSLANDLFADVCVFPQVKDVSLEDIGEAGTIIRAGRRAMKEKINELLAVLK